MEYLENRTFDEMKVGDSASLSRMLMEKDIQVFAIMSGDINPAHVDIEFAKSDMFHEIIGHGMWGGALISTVLGTQLPGPGTIYVNQSLRFKRPVAIGDTLTVTVTVKEKTPEKKRVVLTCECRNQKDEVVIEGEAQVVAPTKKIRRPKAVLPEISLHRHLSLFDDFIAHAKKFAPLTAGVIFPVREKIIQAIDAAYTAGFIKPILVGPKARILQTAEIAKIDVSQYQIIDVDHSHAAINQIMSMARNGEIDLIIRGGVTREDLLRAMQRIDTGLLTDRVMSYASVMDVPTYSKALILTDTLINIDPSLEVKRGITQNAIDFALALGINEPKVAIVSGTDTVDYSMRSTVDAAALCKMCERGQIRGAILDGPLTFDNVISTEVAKSKGIVSPVIGKADILVMPNVETGIMLAKQLEYLAESRNAGLVLGARVPVLMRHITDIDLSTVSCALAILDLEYQKRQTDSNN